MSYYMFPVDLSNHRVNTKIGDDSGLSSVSLD
jgi:hypothetical protein